MLTREEEERRKILDGTYPSKIVAGRQRKHIPGTIEFEQKRRAMKRISPGSEPAILTADAAELVEKYKGTGIVKAAGLSSYPKEVVYTDKVVGKTWVTSLNKYVDTKKMRIIYSSIGVHIVPISDYVRR